MEVTNALLVAMMFMMLLSFGIANIVMMIPALFAERRQELKLYWIHSSWIILLLLVYLNLFWHTLDIFSNEDWQFHDYLYIIIGPVLLFVATHFLLPDPADTKTHDLKTFYFGVARKFFLILALLQVWTIGVDLVLRKGFTASGGFNAGEFVVLLVLASSKQPGLHALGTGAAWLMFISVIILRTVGIIQ
jgi:hypothetical protein